MIGNLKLTAVWLAIFLTWEAAYRVIGWASYRFPAPTHIIDATFRMLNVRVYFGQPVHAGWPWRLPGQKDGPARSAIQRPASLPGATVVSLIRLAVGFAAAIVIGGVLGLLMWRFEFFDELVGPVFLGIQTLPSVCWVPLAILTFGLNEPSIMFVLIMGCFCAIALVLRDGLRSIPPVYQRAGAMLGARGWQLYRYVLLPASMPAMASSLRTGFSFAWRSLMGAELIFLLQNKGLGFMLTMARENAEVDGVVAILIVMIVLGMLADRLVFARLEKRVHLRFGLREQA